MASTRLSFAEENATFQVVGPNGRLPSRGRPFTFAGIYCPRSYSWHRLVRRRARSARALPRPPALANLLTVIGDTLKPKITAVIHPANKGADLQVRADLRVTRVKVVTMPGRGHTTTGSRSEGFVDIHLHPTIRWKDVSGEVCNGYERLLFKEFQVTFQCHQLAAHSLVPDGLCLHVVELLKIPPS